MRDFTVAFAGIEVANPILVTACSKTATLEGMLEVAEAGAGIVCTKTPDRGDPGAAYRAKPLSRNS